MKYLRRIICCPYLRQKLVYFYLIIALDYWASLSQSTYASYILKVIRKGSDITLIGWGAQLAVLKEACEDAAKVSYFHLL